MSNKLLYKSELEYFSIFIFICLTVWVNYLFFEEGYFIANFVFTIFMLFFISMGLFRRVFFWDNYIKVVYPLHIIKTKIIKYEDIVKIYRSNGKGDVTVILYKVANKSKKVTFKNPDMDDYDNFKSFLKEKNITID